ncbi:hypothetical protein OEZ86_010596 [Tetradesmus obliquus]|nr:hypothetical protein OEZ86_010596 [Tetradesmus obliquus]
MEQNQLLDCIDIRLVKEQLLLLGHEVSDDVILSFVKGLAGGGAEQQCADGGAAGTTYQKQQQSSPGLRASSESIIGEANPGGGSSCHDARPRRVSKDGSGPSDPLYRAPVSPTGGAGGSCSSRQAVSGVRKTDRVARFQKMQQAWQKDRYLNTGASRKGPSGISSSRPATTPSVRSKPSWED